MYEEKKDDNYTDYEGFRGRSESYDHNDREGEENEGAFAALPSKPSSKKV